MDVPPVFCVSTADPRAIGKYPFWWRARLGRTGLAAPRWRRVAACCPKPIWSPKFTPTTLPPIGCSRRPAIAEPVPRMSALPVDRPPFLSTPAMRDAPQMRADAEIRIAGRAIGAAHPPFIIAELSGNHNGSIDRALELI